MTKLEKYIETINTFNNVVIFGSEKQGSFTNLYFKCTSFAKEGIEEALNDKAFKSFNNMDIKNIEGEYFFTFINY